MTKDKSQDKLEKSQGQENQEKAADNSVDKEIDIMKDPAQSIDVKQTSEYQELNDKYLRLAAEFDNYKKRQSREFSRLIETAESDLILNLLTVVDDLSRALNHEPDQQENFKQGIELIAAKLDELLKRRGLKEIEALGKQFDPNYHEAVLQVESDDVDDGTIVEEVQKGYLLNDRVLRPARVVVASRKEE
jgi:molecular chaperone GrpE